MKVQIENESVMYNQIKEAGCTLFKSQGFDETSVADVVQKLQIREQDFFLYFKSMGELLEVVWSES
ncbi:MAG: TetR/AcrR family transcriptional regulator [Desulforhopalus sp.]